MGTEWDCGLREWADGHSRSRVNTQAWFGWRDRILGASSGFHTKDQMKFIYKKILEMDVIFRDEFNNSN